MPELSPEEYDELKRDIAERGVMVPIEYDEDGNVLDGHHRLKACSELGITDYPKVIRAGMTEQEKWTHARKLNMARRQLSAEQRRELIRQQLRETPDETDRQLARELGVDHHTVAAQRQHLESVGEIPQQQTATGADGKHYQRHKPVSVFNPTKREERTLRDEAVVERMAETGSSSAVNTAQQLALEEKMERKAFSLSAQIPDGWCRLFRADIRDGLPEVADASVDVIITDPPYPHEYMPLYADLARVASRVLKPGGSMIVLCGHSYLPEVVNALGSQPDIQYYWELSYLMLDGGEKAWMWQRKVNACWKPLLWYVKGDYSGDRVSDVVNSPNIDKRFHRWGQSVGGMAEIVDKFTDAGQTILDPFLGGGTTGVAAVSQGRKFIGSDSDQHAVDTSRTRILSEYASAAAASGD